MERALQGLAASPGVAVGRARLLATASAVEREPIPHRQRQAEALAAEQALDAAAAEIEAIAATLWRSSRGEEAEIVETGVLIARDPSLRQGVVAAVLDAACRRRQRFLTPRRHRQRLWRRSTTPGSPSAPTTSSASAAGQRAWSAKSVASKPENRASGGGEVLIGPDLGPAEVAELDERVTGIALAAGGVSAHAAIVARSLGIPMVIGVGDELLTAADGQRRRHRRKQRCCVPRRRSPSGSEAARVELSRRADAACASDRQPATYPRPRPTGTWCVCSRTSRAQRSWRWRSRPAPTASACSARSWPSWRRPNGQARSSTARALAPIFEQLPGRTRDRPGARLRRRQDAALPDGSRGTWSRIAARPPRPSRRAVAGDRGDRRDVGAPRPASDGRER